MEKYLFLWIFILVLSFLIISNKRLISKLRVPQKVPKLFYGLLFALIAGALALLCLAILYMR